jgi:peptide subunit release factor 1 (eRF1)
VNTGETQVIVPKAKNRGAKRFLGKHIDGATQKKQYVGPIKPFERLKRFNEKNL